jgi:hypothetical protein
MELATSAQLAAVNFGPFSAETIEELTPISSEWLVKLDIHYRVALITLAKSKSDLEELPNKAFFDLMDAFRTAATFLRELAGIIESAEMGVLAAVSSVALANGCVIDPNA